MKPKLLLLFLVFTQLVSAQNYTEVLGTPFIGVAQSSIAFADVDGDNDLDVLITGLNFMGQPPGVRITKLYTNDGSGNYTEVLGTPFAGVEEGSIAFADVDGDNDQDVLVTGRSDEGRITQLYTNDGSGTFTEVIGTPFDGVSFSWVAFKDVDGDNDQDLLITGQNSSFAYISKLYLNNGLGSFTEIMNTPFAGVREGSFAFADVDGDNDQDVLITGSANGGPMARLYTNDGSGNFTEVIGTPFVGVEGSAIAFADVDGDNDQDVLILGQDSANQYITKLYTNDGSGNFVEVPDTPFAGLLFGEIGFADVDGDNDMDVLVTGGTGIFSLPYTGLYTNDGSGNFTEATGTPFTSLTNGSVAFADVDGDNDQDVLITGQDGFTNYTAKLYLYDRVISSSDDISVVVDLNITPFPNPATSNNLQVRFNSRESNRVTLSVYDLNGRLLRQQQAFATIGEQTLVLDIAALPSGSYFLQLENGKESAIAKFIVQ